MSWTFDTCAEATDGSGLITKRVVVERFKDKVAVLVRQSHQGDSHVTLFHLEAPDADALAAAILAAAAAVRKHEEA